LRACWATLERTPQHAAQRLLSQKAPDTRARINHLFKLSLGRPAEKTELRDAEAMLKNFPGDSPKSAWSALCQALFTSAEFRYAY